MSVEVQLNGTALFPQPASTDWDTVIVGSKLDGTDAIGGYDVLVLQAPVESGGTANWNWSTFENQVLTSIQCPARFDTMQGTATTYNSGVVSERVRAMQAQPGGLVRGVEMRIKIVT